jgi:hypothetical protein
LNRGRALLVASIVISILSIGIIYYLSGMTPSLSAITSIDPLYLLLALALHLCFLLLWALRIKILSAVTGYSVSLPRAFKIVLVGAFVAAITPSNIGGEPVRIKMLKDTDEEITGGEATAITLTERIIDLIVFLVAAPLLMLVTGLSVTNPILVKFLFISLGCMVVGIFLFAVFSVRRDLLERAVERLRAPLKRLLKDEERVSELSERLIRNIGSYSDAVVQMFTTRRKVLLASLLPTVLMWLCDMLIPYVLFLGYGYSVDPVMVITTQVLIVILTLVPITPGGSGIAEFVFYGFFSSSVPPGVLPNVILLWRGIVFYLNLVVGGMASIRTVMEGEER